MSAEADKLLTHSQIRDLVAIAVAHIDDPDPEDSSVLTPAWHAIAMLQKSGDRAVLDVCRNLCKSADARERAVAAATIGQLGYSRDLLRDERFGLLKELLDAEVSGDADPEMLQSICFAFGHLKDPRGISSVIPLARHPLSFVRFSVVHALSALDDPAAIAALISLSNDDDSNVRDWATFGLGQLIETDTSEVREALWARLTDSDDNTRLEAISGLASRKDLRVIGHILAALEAGEVAASIYRAVTDLADPIFCKYLRGTKQSGRELPEEVVSSDYLQSEWQDAVSACGCDLRGSERPD